MKIEKVTVNYRVLLKVHKVFSLWLHSLNNVLTKLKFIYSEKAQIFAKSPQWIFLLTCVVTVKFLVEILQNFVAFSEYMSFSILNLDLDKLIRLCWFGTFFLYGTKVKIPSDIKPPLLPS